MTPHEKLRLIAVVGTLLLSIGIAVSYPIAASTFASCFVSSYIVFSLAGEFPYNYHNH